MPAVVLLEKERLLIVDFSDCLKNRSTIKTWEEVVGWLRLHDGLFRELNMREESTMFMELPEGSVQDVSYLVHGLDSQDLTESALIEQLEYHTTETIESLDKDALQKAMAGGRLLKSVLTLLVRQNFSPLGCLILAQQDGKETST